MDECVYDETLLNKLHYMKYNNQTISHTMFCETISENMPEYQPNKLYHQYNEVKIITGDRLKVDDKCLIFNPHKISDINYNPGAHVCEPEGYVKYYNLQNEYPIKTIHIKNLSLQYTININIQSLILNP